VKENKKVKEKIYTRDIILILIACLLYMGSLQMVMPLLAGFTGELGGSGVIMGMICAMVFYVSIVLRPIAGRLVDKYSKFTLAIIGLTFMLIGPVCYLLAKSYVVVIIGRAITGVGYALSSISLTTWISLLMPKKHVGRGMGMFGMMNAIAMAISPYFSINLKAWFGYKAAFALATAFVTTAIILVLLVKDKKNPVEDDKVETTPVKLEKKKFQIMDFKIAYIAIITLLFSIPQMGNQAFLLKYTETMNLPLNTSLYFPIYATVLFLLRTLIKDLFDTVKFSKFMYIGCACTICAMACFTFMKSNFLLYLAGIFMSGSFGLMTSVCQAEALRNAGPGKRGLANSTYYIGLDGGSAFGSQLGGIIYQTMPLQYFYPTLAAVVPLVLLTYGIHILVVKVKANKLKTIA